jgi:hypothetical protein
MRVQQISFLDNEKYHLKIPLEDIFLPTELMDTFKCLLLWRVHLFFLRLQLLQEIGGRKALFQVPFQQASEEIEEIAQRMLRRSLIHMIGKEENK